MKKLVAMLAVIGMASYGWAAETNKTVKILFRDYGVTDTKGVGALSLGVCSWTDKNDDFAVGGYFDVKFLMLWGEKLNFGAGMAIRPYHHIKFDHLAIDPRVETSVTTHLFNCLEIGAYYAPFWGLDSRSDDPWGLLAGYYFKF